MDARKAIDAVEGVRALIEERDRLDNEINSRLVTAYDNGASYQEIGKWTGLARQTVAKRVKAYKGV